MVAPDAPFPKTAASSPGEFKEAYEAAFEAGAEAIVSIHVAGTLSGTIKSAQIARDMLPDREIHVVDSLGASMAEGILAGMGVELAADGRPAAEIAEILEARAPDMRMYVALETLEYLKKGGRISGAQAAIGTLLSVKPIIRVKHGVVDTVDRVRTRGKARERLIELISERPIERLAILHTISPDVEAFRDEVCAQAPAGSTRPTSRSSSSARRSGRTSARAASARRSCIGPDAPGQAPPSRCRRVAARCGKVATTLPTGTIGEARIAESTAILGPQIEPRAAVGSGSDRDQAARPVGSSGRRPEPTAVDRPPDT